MRIAVWADKPSHSEHMPVAREAHRGSANATHQWILEACMVEHDQTVRLCDQERGLCVRARAWRRRDGGHEADRGTDAVQVLRAGRKPSR